MYFCPYRVQKNILGFVWEGLKYENGKYSVMKMDEFWLGPKTMANFYNGVGN